MSKISLEQQRSEQYLAKVQGYRKDWENLDDILNFGMENLDKKYLQ